MAEPLIDRVLRSKKRPSEHSSDDVVVHKKRLTSSVRQGEQQEVTFTVLQSPLLNRAYSESVQAIKAEAERQQTLLVGEPLVEVTVAVIWQGFVFPEGAEDIYQRERTDGQMLNRSVPGRVDTMTFRREPKQQALPMPKKQALPIKPGAITVSEQ